MADEFAKGLGTFTGAGLAWLVLAGWYRTPSFESTHQLVSPVSAGSDALNSLAVTVMELFFWFAVLGTFAFWVLIPAVRRAKDAMAEQAGE